MTSAERLVHLASMPSNLVRYLVYITKPVRKWVVVLDQRGEYLKVQPLHGRRNHHWFSHRKEVTQWKKP